MDWTALRQEFPVTGHWAFFDHAAVAPLSGRARQAMTVWAQDLADNGDANEHRWVERVEEVRRLCGRLLGADPLDVAFIKNTSEGIGIVAEGFPWKPGDNVVTAAEEYPANIYPWMNLADKEVEVRLAPSRDNRLAVEDIFQVIDARTRIVSLSAVEFASGFRNDLAAIGGYCRQRGIFFFVDAIQALGVLPIDVHALPIDFLAADGHKWLLGPEGAGLFYARRELVDRLHPVGVGWNSVRTPRDFSRIHFRLKPHAGRWESGSLNVAGISALGASVELLLEVGVSAIANRVMELTDYLCARVERVGGKIFSSRNPLEKSGIVSIVEINQNPREVVERCRTRRLIINQRGGRIRVSPHCYNTYEEIDRLVALLMGN